MESEWLDVAWINFNKAIMHGRLRQGTDGNGATIEREIEQVLTPEQIGRVHDLNHRHEQAMRDMLKTFVTA